MPMIVMFTDFGLHGPYTGQMKAVLHERAPGIPASSTCRRCAGRQSQGFGVLLAGYAEWFSEATIFLCVVDPGVGGTRPPLVV